MLHTFVMIDAMLWIFMNSVLVSEKSIAHELLISSCLIKLYTTQMRWDKSLQKALMNSVLPRGKCTHWICNWNEAFFKHHVTPPPIYPSVDWSMYSVRPSFKSNRRWGMNLTATWLSRGRFFRKVCLVAAFLFLIICFYNTDCDWAIWFIAFVVGKTSYESVNWKFTSKCQLIIVGAVWQILCRILTGCLWKHGQRRRVSTLTCHWAGTHTHTYIHTFGIQYVILQVMISSVMSCCAENFLIWQLNKQLIQGFFLLSFLFCMFLCWL